MSELPSIAQLGNPILRQLTQSVQSVTDESTQQLIDTLIATVQANNGVGIAAPQLSVSQRLFIVASRPNLRYPHAPSMEPTAMINPRIRSQGSEMVKDWEGCLSIPGLRGLVPRYREIEVEYTDREGHQQRQVLTGFIARIFQHELDHLNGTVFIDRLESTHGLVTEQEYYRRVLD